MEKVTGFLFQLIGAASRNPVCNLPHNPHEKNRFSGLSAQIGDLVVILADGCGWTDIHKSTSCFGVTYNSKILIILYLYCAI